MDNLPRVLWLKQLQAEEDTLRLLLVNEPETLLLTLTFRSVAAYRVTDEGDRLTMWSELDAIGRIGPDHWPLYTVTDSNLAGWIRSESGGRYYPENLHHFMVLTPEEVVDVVLDSDLDPEAMLTPNV